MTDNSVDEITRLYFEQDNILIKHQIDSYNDYIDNIIPNILSQFFPITIDVSNNMLNIQSITIDIDKYFPLLTGKKMYPHIYESEFKWFIYIDQVLEIN